MRAPDSCTALRMIVSNTGWTSVGELLMTRRISLVAVCCSRASVRSAFFVCSSWRSRAFSIAITAWSAKVSMRAIWLSVNARTSCRKMRITPSSSPARSMGIARVVRLGSISRARSVYSGSAWTSRMWTVRRSRAARALALWRPGAMGLSSRKVRSSGATFWTATTRSTRPSKRVITARFASHSRIACSARVSNTGCRSKVERPITLSSSLVAVCCSSATRSSPLRSSSSLNRRTFSIAMTAWSAKVFSSVDLPLR